MAKGLHSVLAHASGIAVAPMNRPHVAAIAREAAETIKRLQRRIEALEIRLETPAPRDRPVLVKRGGEQNDRRAADGRAGV
jgi:hypothetical protein